MIPNMNPRMMKQAMKRMGIQQQDIDAEQVIIKTADKDIIIDQPSVAKINMMGQVSFQISGAIREEGKEEETLSISEEDIQTVVAQTGSTAEEAKEALEAAKGDIAEAIMKLKEDSE